MSRIYDISINPVTGTLNVLHLKCDPDNINLVHRSHETAFGALVYTANGTESVTMGDVASPSGVEGLRFAEKRSFAQVVSKSDTEIVSRNIHTGHTIKYLLFDEYFDIWLDGDLPIANQVGLDLDVMFMDLRQNDTRGYQFTAKSPYRSEDGSLCYVYLDRPCAPGMLVTALTSAAGWRLRYGSFFSGVEHAVQGLQMLARFDTAIDQTAVIGPVHFGVRISFHYTIEQSREFIVSNLGVPIVTAPVEGAVIGSTLCFQIQGPVKRVYLYAARAFLNDDFYEHSIRIAQAHIADNVDASGMVSVYGHIGSDNVHDYTTVIAPLQALIELTLEMESRNDPRVVEIRLVCIRIADYLVRRGLNFPTEGMPPQMRWTEDGSISCTALSLLFAYYFLERKPEYLEFAHTVLNFHEPWRIDVPDVRMLDSTYRYWETLWENDGEGRSINAGHAWTLWRAEALYYYTMITGDALSLVQSYNGYQANLAQYMPDGMAYSCFTPDYIHGRPRKFKPTHCYPDKPDKSLAFYVWPRIAETWMRTFAIVDPATIGYQCNIGPICLNCIIEDGYTIRPEEAG